MLGGKVRLRQTRSGHRAGTDAVLLGASVPAEARGRAVDIGAGTGAAGLMALSRATALDMTFVEIDPALCDLCAQNIAENGVSSRARAACADVLAPAARRSAGLADGTFDFVLTNPPFHDSGTIRRSPDAAKARAHVVEGGVERWMKAALALLAPGGRFFMIHRADALAAILAAADGRLGELRVLPVHAKEKEPAIRLLLSGKKGSRAPLALLPPLVLHADDGRFTPLAEALHRGEQGLSI